ncbi:MAG: polysaccharide biosynthesis/export family protein [bacterium]
MKRNLVFISLFLFVIATPAFAQGDLSSIMQNESAIPESPTAARFFDLTMEPIIKSIGDDYLLGPGDILTINLGNITADEVQQQISSQGDIMLPTIGKVKIEGLTVAGAENALNEACGKYFRNFDVRIQVNQVRKIEVYLVGQVHQPGIYLCYSGTTLSQFMQLTGRLVFSDPSIAGFGERTFYNRTNPLFKQVLPEGSIRQVELRKKDRTSIVDLTDVIIRGDKSNDIRLDHGDVVFIPRLENSIIVKGGVNPGRYEILDGDKIDDIILIAGGSGSMNLSEVIAVDNVDDVTLSSRTVNLNSGTYGDDNSPFALKNDMIIRLPQHQEYVYIIGAVPYPGQKDFVEGDTLMDYLGRSGGFLPGNQMGATDIIRRKGLGQKRDVIHIDLKKVLKSETAGDIMVYPGDIIFVPPKNQPFSGRDVIATLLGLGGLIEAFYDNQ